MENKMYFHCGSELAEQIHEALESLNQNNMARKKYITDELGEKKLNKSQPTKKGFKPNSQFGGYDISHPVYFPKKKY